KSRIPITAVLTPVSSNLSFIQAIQGCFLPKVALKVDQLRSGQLRGVASYQQQSWTNASEHSPPPIGWERAGVRVAVDMCGKHSPKSRVALPLPPQSKTRRGILDPVGESAIPSAPICELCGSIADSKTFFFDPQMTAIFADSRRPTAHSPDPVVRKLGRLDHEVTKLAKSGAARKPRPAAGRPHAKPELDSQC